jgi:hypothetical protein
LSSLLVKEVVVAHPHQKMEKVEEVEELEGMYLHYLMIKLVVVD